MGKQIPIFTTIPEMREFVYAAKAQGKSIGFVPTMGALHEGHLSLIRRAAAENALAIVSIFVNPLQFDDKRDFENYPVTLARDADLAAEAGACAILAPQSEEMYPEGFSTFVDMTGKVSETLCGASRAGHFRGVCTVVAKLFAIVLPDRAYFGEKDAQQLASIEKMVRELAFPIEIVPCATIREKDGLALSSRNERLSPEARKAATCLFRALTLAKTLFEGGEQNAEKLKTAMRAEIEKEPLARIDYIAIVHPQTFENIKIARAGSLAALAIYFGETRLIDNLKF